MRRADLEHIIRAAAAITGEYEWIIIGSQSILGAIPDAPADVLYSREADIYPLKNIELGDLIDGTMGEQSPFDTHFGYYAQGVGPETATLPTGWERRLSKIQNANTDFKIGYCLDPHDLAISKLVAGREKDFLFVSTLVQHQLLSVGTLHRRLAQTVLPETRLTQVSAWLTHIGQAPISPAPRGVKTPP